MDIPWETLQRVSPQSMGLKRFVKVPMIISAMSAALLGSLYVVSMKLIGELIVLGLFKEDWEFIIVLFLISTMFGILCVYKFTQCQMFY